MTEKISYSVVAGGNSNFLRAFAIPLADELGKLKETQYIEVPKNNIFEHDSNPKAFDLATAGFFGIVLLLPGWFAVKVIDEFYDIKIKPLVRKIIYKADSIEIFSKRKNKKVFTLSVFHEECDVLVIVAIKEENLESMDAGLARFSSIHAAANNIIQSGSHKSEVHLYVLSGGKVNAQPYIHNNIESAHNQIST